MAVNKVKLTEINQVVEKIGEYEARLEIIKNQKKFPFVYLTAAFPITGFFILGSIISDGIIDIFSATVGGLFFSLLITCIYIVVFQQNKEEMEEELKYELKYLWRLKAKLEAGKKGEKEIAYYLTWLKNKYLIFNDIEIHSEKYGNQQIDHLAIGHNGIFHIETKNINGTIKISSTGDWILEKKLRSHTLTEGMESPHHQIRRHELVIKDILSKHLKPKEISKIHLEPIVAMANSRTIIQGKDPVLEVVKKDKLIYHIENSGKHNLLTKSEIKKIGIILALNSGVDDEQTNENAGA